MNTETIGISAGSVWEALNTAESLSIKQLNKITRLKDKETFAALGWLAREGKISIVPDPEDEKELLVSLEGDK